jgi:hypothetical protein
MIEINIAGNIVLCTPFFKKISFFKCLDNQSLKNGFLGVIGVGESESGISFAILYHICQENANFYQDRQKSKNLGKS